MKISGSVINSVNSKPVVLAKIRFKASDKEIGMAFTDEVGGYEFKTDEKIIGQTLTFTIEKEGFEEKIFSSVADKAEIYKEFSLREHRKVVDKWAKFKWFITGIFGVVVILYIIFFFLVPEPELHCNLKGDVLELNNKTDYFCNISNTGLFSNWSLSSEKKWIFINKPQGSGDQTVGFTIYTPDDQYSPNPNPYYEYITLEKDIGYFWKTKSDVISFKIPDKKGFFPILSVKIDPDQTEYKYEPIILKITNNNSKEKEAGELYWTIRNNVTWMKLLTESDERDMGKVELSDYLVKKESRIQPRFSLDTSVLDKEFSGNNTKVYGRITVESNNDGKIKLYISITKKDGKYYLSHYKTEDYSKPEIIFERNSTD